MKIERTIAQLFDLSGKVVLITGASGYLGSSMARGLAEAGASVVVASRDRNRAEAAAKELGGNGTHAGVAIDHMDEDSMQEGFQNAISLAGKVDILVNNGHEPLGEDWKTVNTEQFSGQLANASGYFALARLVRNHAVDRDAPASIIMLGSMYGQVGSYPETYEGICIASPVAYHTLKGGIIHLTRHLAVYWAKDNVRVNCLSPGPFPNDAKAPAEMVERLCQKSPMGRMGQPCELKGAVVFLASDASSYMTGQNLTIDGGWTAW